MTETPADAPPPAAPPEATEAVDSVAEAPNAFDSGKRLRGSELLTPTEASTSLAAGGGRVIVWAGARESGKTTLSAELYERHRQGRAKTCFASSRTLLGFEERIHPSRAASGRVKPHTPRTENDPEERELLHLCVATSGAEANLVFSDLPGETFRRIVNNEASPADFPLLSRADKLAFIADGALLADPGVRPTVVSFINQLLDRFDKAELPTEATQSLLLLTKQDQLLARPEAVDYWEKHEQKLLEKLQAISPNASALRTAARTNNRELEDGMENLMEWVLSSPSYEEDPDLPIFSSLDTRFERLARPKRLR